MLSVWNEVCIAICLQRTVYCCRLCIWKEVCIATCYVCGIKCVLLHAVCLDWSVHRYILCLGLSVHRYTFVWKEVCITTCCSLRWNIFAICRVFRMMWSSTCDMILDLVFIVWMLLDVVFIATCCVCCLLY